MTDCNANEHQAPSETVNHQTTDNRADSRAGGHDDTGHAHGGAALIRRIDEHRHYGDQWQQHAGAGGLQYASDEQQHEIRRDGTQQCADHESGKSSGEELSGGEFINQIA